MNSWKKGILCIDVLTVTPEAKQSRSRRKIIGKIDPETGKVIPTGTGGREGRTNGSQRKSPRPRSPNEILQNKVDKEGTVKESCGANR